MRAPNDPQEAQKVPKWSPRGSPRVPKVAQKGPKRDPKGYPKEVQKRGPILGALYSWILMPVSHGITIFRTCLSKEREARFIFRRTAKPGETKNDSTHPLENIVFSRMVAFGRAWRRALGHAQNDLHAWGGFWDAWRVLVSICPYKDLRVLENLCFP